MAKRLGSAVCAAVVAGSLVLGAGGTAAAAVHVKAALRATAQAPRARGSAKLTLRTSTKGLFAISARRLDAGGSYDVVVAGIKVGELATNDHGAGKALFGAPKRNRRALLGFDPRGRSLAIRDRAGNDVLDCDMPDGGKDSGAVACCLPDDDGVECDERTPDDCLADGGTVSNATGCFPDPCSAPGTATCCTIDSTCGAFVDDDPQVGCHTGVSASACADAHGTVVDATSCDPNPCTPVPPAALVTCCVPEDDEDEIECEFRTPDRCAAKGGTVNAATSCSPNPCGPAQSSDADHHGDGDHNDGDHGDGDHCDHHHHDGDHGDCDQGDQGNHDGD